jgi:cobalamin biosynthetic protein CobC
MRAWFAHGGAVDLASAQYGIEQALWLDLSTGINGDPYPVHLSDPQCWSRLPGRQMEERVARCARAYYRVPDHAEVVPVPGSQAAIQWLPRLLARSRVTVIGPTYAEHERAWHGAGHDVACAATPNSVPDGTDVLVLANPNNPDGRTVPRGEVLALAERARLVVVDEAFADTAPGTSIAPFLPDRGVVVLRSFGKFFGLAGLRLGFVLCGAPWAERLRAAVGPWSVSGPALSIGARALADDAWIEASRARLETDARRLDALLMEHGLRVVGGTTLFRLTAAEDAGATFEALARSAVLVRPFADRPDWLRFGIPAGDAQFSRLAAALASA